MGGVLVEPLGEVSTTTPWNPMMNVHCELEGKNVRDTTGVESGLVNVAGNHCEKALVNRCRW